MTDSTIQPRLSPSVHHGRLDFNDEDLSPLDVFVSPVTDPFIALMTDADACIEPTRVSVRGHIKTDSDATFRQKIRYDRQLAPEGAGPYSLATASVGGATMVATTYVRPGRFPTTNITSFGSGKHVQVGRTERLPDANGVHLRTHFGPYRIDMHACYDEKTGGLLYKGAIRNQEAGTEVGYELHTVKVTGSTATDWKNAISGYVGDLEVYGSTTVAGNKIEVERHIGPYHISQVIRQEYRY